MGTPAVYLLLLLALVVANLPFISQRIFFVRPAGATGKHLGWRLLELLVGYFLVGIAAYLIERQVTGDTYPQRWEFYAVTGCIFLVLAFPGFVYRLLWRGGRSVTPPLGESL